MFNATKIILNRVEESKKRPKIIEEANKKISEYEKRLINMTKTHPWIAEEQKHNVSLAINETNAWIAEKLTQQSNLKLYQTPAFNSTDIESRVRNIKEKFIILRNIPKPRIKNVILKKYNNFYYYSLIFL